MLGCGSVVVVCLVLFKQEMVCSLEPHVNVGCLGKCTLFTQEQVSKSRLMRPGTELSTLCYQVVRSILVCFHCCVMLQFYVAVIRSHRCSTHSSFLKSALSCSVITTSMVFMHEEKYINSKYRKTNMVIVVVDKHISYYRHWTRKLEK